MPLPAIAGAALAIVEFIAAALTAYEVLKVVEEIYEGIEKYNQGVDKAKQELKELIERLKQEIDQKIAEREEMAILLAAAGADPQNPVTRKAEGRGGGVRAIDVAIQQKIPFRQVISMICEKADAMPVISLRRKKGVQIKDLPRAKREVLEAILSQSLESLTDVDIESFIVVRLKQLAANLMFEFIDHCLDWRSPLKCEVSFGPRPDFEDHPVEGATKLQRRGKLNPFYPAPHRGKGSIAADLIIPDYRRKRCDKGNIFAIVEIKFPGDAINEQQFKQYRDLLAYAAKVKTKATPVRHDNKAVAFGGRLSLFRYPEDIADKSKSRDSKRSDKKPGKKPGTHGG